VKLERGKDSLKEAKKINVGEVTSVRKVTEASLEMFENGHSHI
jgi:hypothetical protein